ncbi:hypothetical protein BKA69DRAFT_1093749 [Paraphysoderma sedebokerense]|nr:hypothetical protein BKA69DRAFT_1093749 [Paraphysoderma sedebokerense]
MSDMHIFENRLDSFKSRFKWPHGSKHIANPESLAKAGFYFDPLSKSSDNVICFLCSKSLEGWDANDDPYQEHLSHSPNCGWALVVCASMVNDNNADLNMANPENWPTSKAMEQARLDTFGNWWPHQKTKGFACSMKRMAKAGFYFCPSRDSEDMAGCIYCGVTLDGWEPSDSAIKEHRKRAPNCIFFQKPSAVTKVKTTATQNSALESTVEQEMQLNELPKIMTPITAQSFSPSEVPALQPTEVPDDDNTTENNHTDLIVPKTDENAHQTGRSRKRTAAKKLENKPPIKRTRKAASQRKTEDRFKEPEMEIDDENFASSRPSVADLDLIQVESEESQERLVETVVVNPPSEIHSVEPLDAHNQTSDNIPDVVSSTLSPDIQPPLNTACPPTSAINVAVLDLNVAENASELTVEQFLRNTAEKQCYQFRMDAQRLLDDVVKEREKIRTTELDCLGA